MNPTDILHLVLGFLRGFASTTVFILLLFIGFCTLVGFMKMKKTAGGGAMVVKSLDERLTHEPMQYMPSDTPRGPTDQLRAPELVEAAARK